MSTGQTTGPQVLWPPTARVAHNPSRPKTSDRTARLGADDLQILEYSRDVIPMPARRAPSVAPLGRPKESTPPAVLEDPPNVRRVGHTMPPYRIREFARLSATFQWDIRAIMAAAEVERSPVGTSYRQVTLRQAVAMLQYLRRSTEDEFLGLGPLPVSRNVIRVLAFALSGAPTLGDALTRAEQFAPVFAGIPAPSVASAAGRTTVALDLRGFDSSSPLVVDSLLVVTHRLINWGIRSELPLLRVEVPYERPHGETDYDVLFGAPVSFGRPSASLSFPCAALTAPIARRHDEIDVLLDDLPASLASGIEVCGTHTQRVRSIVERCIGERVCNATDIAAGMGVSRQTLRRRLHAEDTSVSAIRDEVLRAAALSSLSNGKETVAALAVRLGFSEPSAFTRAFRRWTGESPSTYVRRHREMA